MNLTYTKISDNLIKLFYQDGDKYGEFYLRFKRLTRNLNHMDDPLGVSGEAILEAKDRDYAPSLINALAHELYGEAWPVSELINNQFMAERKAEAEREVE